jgi:hypothetical protein
MTRAALHLLATVWFLFSAASHPLRAELRWDTQRIDLKPSPVEVTAEGKFGFVNAGKEPVTIEAVKSSCGCTVPTLAKMTYAPGERGEVTAKFNIGDRRGVQSATIRVSVKGGKEPATLTLNVAIPEVAKINPSILIWKPDEKPEPKSLEVEAVPGQSLSVEKVTTSEPGFEAKVETVTEGARYRVIVSPKETEKAGFALLNIETKIKEGTKVLRAYAQVRSNVNRAPMTALPQPPPSAPAVVEIEPALVAWDQGSAPAAKTILVRAASGGTATIANVTTSTAGFEAKTETIKDGSEYRVTITPKSTDKAELAFVTIEIDSGTGKATERAYVQIVPAPAK